MKQLAFGVALLATNMACSDGGGSKDAEEDYGFRDGPPPTETVLCALSVGVSTRADTIAVLGMPTSSVESAESAMVDYWYGDPLAGAVDELHSLSLRFDEDGLFSDVSVSNLPLPSCWRTQLLQQRNARRGK